MEMFHEKRANLNVKFKDVTEKRVPMEVGNDTKNLTTGEKLDNIDEHGLKSLVQAWPNCGP